MARRVKQSDGTYCYTDNCRIHDRSLSDSTGLEAVIADAREAQRVQYSALAADVLKEKLGEFIPEELHSDIANKVMTGVFHVESGSIPMAIAEELKRVAEGKSILLSEMECVETAHQIYTQMDRSSIINRGDEVILNDTGERGTISEGSTAFDGVIRFNPEDSKSRNSFSWFRNSDVTKVSPHANSLAREEILAAPRDALIPAEKVREMIQQETSPKTRNAQANREFSKRNGNLSRSILREFGDKLNERFEGKGLTKAHIIRVLNAEYQRPQPELSRDQISEVKAGLGNIIIYLEARK